MRKKKLGVFFTTILTTMSLAMGNIGVAAAEFSDGTAVLVEEMAVPSDSAELFTDSANAVQVDERESEENTSSEIITESNDAEATYFAADPEMMIEESEEPSLAEESEEGGDEEIFEEPVDTGLTLENEDTVQKIVLRPGESAELTVNASANEGVKLSYTWVDTFEKILQVGDSHIFRIDEITPEYCQYCICYVEDNFGNQKKIEFDVEVDTGLVVPQTLKEVSGVEGSTVLLDTEAAAYENTVLNYSWTREEPGLDTVQIMDCTERFMEVQVEAEPVEYGCAVSDEYGNMVTVTFKVSPAEVNQFQVSFDANGGENAPEMQKKETDQALTLTSDVPIRKGYQFLGWAAKADAKEVLYKAGAEYAENENIVLYAVWKANTYKIQYYKNGGTGKMTSSAATYGKNKTLRTNTFTREGYIFKGWNTKRDGSGNSYADAQKVKNLTSEQSKTVGLYAQWEAVTYSITYDLNKGTNSDKNPVSYTIESEDISLKKPTRKGYTFKGWYTSEEWKTKVTEIKNGSTGNIKLYAKWSANEYSIKYYKNGGTGSMKGSSATYGKSKTLRTNTFTRKGYTFDGWNTKRDGSGTAYEDAQKVKNLTSTAGGSKSLYAQWKPITYTISYDLNKGTNHDDNPTSYDVEFADFKLEKPTRKGYTFKGWYTSEEWTTKVEEIKTGTTGNLKFYAKWQANTYKIKYYSNGGTGTMKGSEATYGKNKTLRTNIFYKKGYVFDSWNTKADGSGKSYGDAVKVKNLTSTNGKTVKLYAQWKPLGETTVGKNIDKLETYISSHGKWYTEDSCYGIVEEEFIDDNTYFSVGMFYKPGTDKMDLQIYTVVEDEYDIEFFLAVLLDDAQMPEASAYFETGVYNVGVLTIAEAILNANTYNGSNAGFKVTESVETGSAYIAEMEQIAENLLGAAFEVWNEGLKEKLNMTVKDIGFTAYSYKG